MQLWRTTRGLLAHDGARWAPLAAGWDDIFNAEDPAALLARALDAGAAASAPTPAEILPPIGGQEVWAAGVTYRRSHEARREESQAAGGGTFYDRVYDAPRPELFFKATPHRVVGHGQTLRLRSDARWQVPEPELALAIDRRGRIVGWTIGDDLSSRDIEGENPLYLPQAKVWSRCAALGPALMLGEPPRDAAIALEIRRGGAVVCAGSTSFANMRREPAELVSWLMRDNEFPVGCWLMTGTGIVPGDGFTLAHGDEIRIAIPPLGELVNAVAAAPGAQAAQRTTQVRA